MNTIIRGGIWFIVGRHDAHNLIVVNFELPMLQGYVQTEPNCPDLCEANAVVTRKPMPANRVGNVGVIDAAPTSILYDANFVRSLVALLLYGPKSEDSF